MNTLAPNAYGAHTLVSQNINSPISASADYHFLLAGFCLLFFFFLFRAVPSVMC